MSEAQQAVHVVESPAAAQGLVRRLGDRLGVAELGQRLAELRRELLGLFGLVGMEQHAALAAELLALRARLEALEPLAGALPRLEALEQAAAEPAKPAPRKRAPAARKKTSKDAAEPSPEG